MEKVRNKRRSHAEMSLLSISALYSKQRDPEQQRLRMTNKMSSPMRPPAGLGDLRLIKSFVSKVFFFFITTQSAEDFRQRRSGMTALLDVKAFTLVELLVVVLIIGILSAIAIPMYQGAVDKSHWSTMLPASKAIKDAEEAFKMTNGEYSDTMEHLDVQISNSDLQFTLDTHSNGIDADVIRVTSSKLGDNVRLASYLDDSPKFAGQLHCEAKNEGSTPNARGQRLCEKLLGGQELNTVDDYTRYLLDQSIDKATCNNVNLKWSNKTNSCYRTKEDRCTQEGGVYQNSVCRYTNQNNITADAGDTCKVGGAGGCNDSTFNEGSTCDASEKNGCSGSAFNGATCIAGRDWACGNTNAPTEFHNNAVCISNMTNTCKGDFYSGSSCQGNGGYTCRQATFHEGSKCVANSFLSCFEAKYEGGCCENGVAGQNYCGNAPKC